MRAGTHECVPEIPWTTADIEHTGTVQVSKPRQLRYRIVGQYAVKVIRLRLFTAECPEQANASPEIRRGILAEAKAPKSQHIQKIPASNMLGGFRVLFANRFAAPRKD